MKKINLYIVIESLGPFFAGAFFFTFVFVIQLLPELFKLIVQNDAPIFKSVEIFFYMLPFNIAITIPMSVLMASIMGYGRLSSDNEVIAMRALGLSHLSIYKPIIIFGAVATIFAFLFNNVVMSESNYRYRALLTYIVNIRPSVAVSELEFRNIPDMNISIGAEKVTKSNMFNVVIYDNRQNSDNAKRIITAETGEWLDNIANSKLIVLKLHNGIVQEVPRGDTTTNTFTVFDTLDINILRSVQNKIGGHERGLREMSSWNIMKKVTEIKKRSAENITNYVRDTITNAYVNYLVSNNIQITNLGSLVVDSSIITNYKTFREGYLTNNIEEFRAYGRKTYKNAVPYYYYVEFHKFYSIPAACFFMVLVGAPLGIVGKRSGKGFGFGISVMVVVFYYLLITGAELVAGAKVVPPFFAMWFPNLVLLAIGGTFIIKSFFSRGK